MSDQPANTIGILTLLTMLIIAVGSNVLSFQCGSNRTSEKFSRETFNEAIRINENAIKTTQRCLDILERSCSVKSLIGK